MRVIMVGAGEVGYHVAERLTDERHDVVVVDVDPDRLDYVSSHLDVAVIVGSGTSPTVLEQAGIQKAGLLIAVTNMDEVNLVCCMTARSEHRIVKVARVSNPDFYGQGQHLYPERFGVDVLINPERELALETIRLLQATAATDIAVFADGAVQLIGLQLTPESPIAGRKLQDIAVEEGDRPLLIVAVQRNGKTIVPKGSTVLQGNDQLYIAATVDEIPHALELCGHQRAQLKRVMIAGGSVEAFYLAQLLHQHGVQATLLVAERERAQELAEKLEKALILHGDATDVELLELEGVGGMDAFIALTDEDDTNILSSLVAKHSGAKQVITLVNKSEYVPLASRIGLDAAVSPRLSAANAILRLVRRGSVTRVATFKGTDAEAIAFYVSAEAPIVNRRLKDLEFPEGAIVAAIIHGGEVTVPRGSDIVRVGDQVVVFALPDAIQEVIKLFPS
ncbi:MAG: Trk system potassium transporter TrkA [Gemmatimonadales bacterium]